MDNIHPALFALVVIITCVVLSRLIRMMSLRLFTFMAERSRGGRANAWVVRLPRVGSADDDNLEMFRRDQRVRATAILVSRVANTLLVLVGIVMMLVRLEVDIAWLVGSAGFVGFGLAISAQYSLQDVINGFHVLFEDRFFEGDEIEVGSGEHRTAGRVERVGMFSTRLRDQHVTLHIANRELVQVRNRSQRGYALHLEVNPTTAPSEERVKAVVEGALDQVVSGSTPSIVVDRLTTTGSNGIGVDARLTAPLSTQEHTQLADEVRRRLGHQPEFED